MTGKFKLLAMAIVVLAAEHLYATVKAPAASAMSVINKSDVPVSVNYTIRRNGHKSNQTLTSGVILPGKSSTIGYEKKDDFLSMNIIYYKADGKASLDEKQITAVPTSIATKIYVYGNSSVAAGGVVNPTSSNPLLSRAVAYWSGPVLNPSSPGYDASKQPVSMYTFAQDGKSTIMY